MPRADGDDEEELEASLQLHSGGPRSHVAGTPRIKDELDHLLRTERAIDESVLWAATNGDRSENGDYLYGKKRLREIDRRIRF